MRNAPLALVVATLVSSVALAQDGARPGAPPPKPMPVATTAPAPKRERKADPQAEALLKRYASLLHFPNAKYKTLAMQTHCRIESLGGEIGCKFQTSAAGEMTSDVQLPEAMRTSYPPEQLAMVKSAIGSRVGQFFKPLLIPADVMALQYDVALKEEKGEPVVELKRFDDKAAWDSLKLTFDKDGLLKRQVGTPHVDPNDLVGAMDAGVEVELTLEHRKRGEQYTIEAGKIVKPMGETTLKIAYYELDGQAPLPRTLVFADPMMGNAEVAVAIHDYVLNGRPLASTARKDEKKPAAPPPATPPKSPPSPPSPR